MSQVRELLNVSPHFMRSVNLERDFSDPCALDGYVTTTEAISHLGQIANGLRKGSGQRAWKITGDFGSGKSSFALLLANLMGRETSEIPKTIRSLLPKLGMKPATGRFLPVLVTGSREPMSQAVLRGLVAALNRSLPAKTKFPIREKAAALLENGEYQDRDVVALFEQAASALSKGNTYGGILLIIDELGKFLEFAALNPETQDVFLLQSLAEASSRSDGAQIHVIGLLHQGIAEYAEKLSITAQREWAKIGERFGEIPFSQPLGQVTTLLSAALGVDADAKALKKWKSIAKRDMGEAVALGMFGPAPGKTELSNLAPSLFPLHPTLVPALSKFFRRFGQNERSLFSFLLSSEPFALQDFAERSIAEETAFRLADFYDFAAYNFSHRLGSLSYRSHWSHIDAVVRGAVNEEAETQLILKTVGILNVLETPELTPSFDILSLCLSHPQDLKKRLQVLCQRGVLFNRGASGYSLWPYTSVNLEQRFIAASEALNHALPIAEVVQERLDSRPVVARRHYIQSGSLRYFEVRFIAAAEFAALHGEMNAEYPADGVIIVVLCESPTDQAAAEKTARKLKDKPQLLVAISSPLESLASYSLNLERWLWVERYTPELKDDRFAAEEVTRQVAAAAQTLELRINEYVGFRGNNASCDAMGIAWFSGGKPVRELQNREISLQGFLSAICDELFKQAPSVRNELINRHAISSSAASARQKLFKAMLEKSSLPMLDLPEDKAPPEKSMYLSVLEAGRIHSENQGAWSLAFPEPESDPLNLRPALDAILARLETTPDQRVRVSDLYDLLRSKPLGVRDGLIPLLLLIVFIVHETEIAIYEDDVFQPEIEEFLMMRLAKRPETFEFQLCRITGVRKALISELAAVVNADRAESSQLLSIVRPLYLFVAGLPDYARNTDQLSPETLALRKAIEAAREPAELVFQGIPRALGMEPKAKAKLDPSALAKKLGQSISELRRCFPELQGRMSAAILEAFKYDGTLEAWRQSISGSAETVLIGLGDPDFRSFCLKLIATESPDAEWLESLGSLLTRLPPSRWKDRDELVFRERIIALAAQFNRVLATCFLRDGSLPDKAIRLAVTPRSGIEKNLVVNLSPKQSKESDKLITELRKHMSADSQISLAALSQLLWDMLPNEQ